ncbi:hypothetical protein [Caballeronia sp. SL2Y3]|uniref:hypothetical protein n=1 Tax=Caballeronia sp. SL2Y3 TaxID=2878151 RepID=UPI001FD4355F|nr:hypothetical protein [Caballeronia sp. SL2Y3]
MRRGGASFAPATALRFSPAPGPITLDLAIRDFARLLANEAEQLTRLRFGVA